MLESMTEVLLIFVIALGPPIILICLLDWICEHFISDKILDKISAFLFGMTADDFLEDGAEDEDEDKDEL